MALLVAEQKSQEWFSVQWPGLLCGLWTSSVVLSKNTAQRGTRVLFICVDNMVTKTCTGWMGKYHNTLLLPYRKKKDSFRNTPYTQCPTVNMYEGYGWSAMNNIVMCRL